MSERKYLPRPIAKRPAVRKGFALTAIATLLLAFIGQDLHAQLVPSGNRFILWDGTDTASITAGGKVEVTCDNCGGSGGTSSSFGSAFPASGTAAGFNDGTNMQGARVYDLDSGGGTHYILGVSLRRTASGTPVELIGQATMANSVPVTIASDQAAVPASQSGTWTVQPGNTANTTAWLMKNYPVTGCGGTVFDHALQAAPTSATNITTTTTCVGTVFVANTNSSAQTILVQDNQGSPITAIPTTNIPGNSTAIWDLGGTKLTSGIKVTAGGTGMTIAVLGYQ